MIDWFDTYVKPEEVASSGASSSAGE
jgi:hypothetical protein